MRITSLQSKIMVAGIAVLINANAVLAHGAESKTIDGTIGDSMCKTQHEGMMKSGKYGKNAAECIKKCAQQGMKMVVVDKSGTAYSIVNPKLAEKFAGQQVHVEGHVDDEAKTVHIHSIKKY